MTWRCRTSGRLIPGADRVADVEPPLSHLRVLEIATQIAGPYAGKLFADAGADVVKVEPAGGDPMRRWTAGGPIDEGDSALFSYLNTSKRSVLGAPDDAFVLGLAAAADVVIVDAGVPAAALSALRAARACVGRRGHHAVRAAWAERGGACDGIHLAGAVRFDRWARAGRPDPAVGRRPAGGVDRRRVRGGGRSGVCAARPRARRG